MFEPNRSTAQHSSRLIVQLLHCWIDDDPCLISHCVTHDDPCCAPAWVCAGPRALLFLLDTLGKVNRDNNTVPLSPRRLLDSLEGDGRSCVMLCEAGDIRADIFTLTVA